MPSTSAYVLQSLVLTIRLGQKTVKVPILQFIDKNCSRTQATAKASSQFIPERVLFPQVQYIVKVVDVPVEMRRTELATTKKCEGHPGQRADVPRGFFPLRARGLASAQT